MPTPLPRPRKHLGQHFLIDANISRKIVTLAALAPGDTVLEIGPGRGALTRLLCERASRVIAIEVDRDLHAHLRDTLADCPALELHQGDALAFPYATVPAGTVVVANLPYNISTPVLFALLEARARFARLILMLQTEVAQRLVAPPGSRAYGVLSVLAQAVADVRIAFTVARTCFRPPPAVGSSVVRVEFPHRMPVEIADMATFTAIVRAAFAHRRKTLTNSLRDEGFAPSAVAAALAEAGIAAGDRAERLSIADFARLSAALPVTPLSARPAGKGHG
jgi:16S rRNA (adenine1518-N6/adenine1519-N6)-dimethyltransferase